MCHYDLKKKVFSQYRRPIKLKKIPKLKKYFYKNFRKTIRVDSFRQTLWEPIASWIYNEKVKWVWTFIFARRFRYGRMRHQAKEKFIYKKKIKEGSREARPSGRQTKAQARRVNFRAEARSRNEVPIINSWILKPIL